MNPVKLRPWPSYQTKRSCDTSYGHAPAQGLTPPKFTGVGVGPVASPGLPGRGARVGRGARTGPPPETRVVAVAVGGAPGRVRVIVGVGGNGTGVGVGVDTAPGRAGRGARVGRIR